MPRADGVNYTGGNEMWGYGTCGEVPFRSSRVPTITFVLVPVCELGDESRLPWLIFVWGNLGRRRVGDTTVEGGELEILHGRRRSVGDTTRSKEESWRYYTVEGGELEILHGRRRRVGDTTRSKAESWRYYTVEGGELEILHGRRRSVGDCFQCEG